MANPRAVGIDLGTTYSAVACLDEAGKSAIVRNSEGQILTPSVVFFDQDEVVVGKAAKQVASVESARVAECVKRDMGSPYYSRPINGQNLPPEVIQACILRKLKEDAQAVLGRDFKVVITVPAYFDEPRRKATADAGEMAGLDVLDIVNEPTAAALAFGEQLGYLSPTGDPMRPMKVMVYDLGGGTFDVTIIDLSPGDIRTIATDGDVQLGGRDWDDTLAAFAAQAFQSQYGVDVRQDPAAAGKLMIEVEDAKHTLSQRDHAVIRVEHKGNAIDVPVTRLQFEQMTEGLLERTAFTTRQVIAAAGLTWQDISRMLLVGGSTRMPMVMSMIQQLSGIAPDRSINPDEAVARGAALFAGYQLRLQGAAAGGKFNVTDVNAHSLGLQGIAEETLSRENVIVIPKNTPLPAKVERQFVTQRDGQKSIIVRVLEGESKQPDLCSQIGRSVLRDLPPGLPKGYPINVIFSYATNGRLNVEAVLSGTQRKVRIELEREHGMTSAQINRWRQLFGGDVGEPSTDSLLREAFRDPNYSTPQKTANAASLAENTPAPQAAVGVAGTTAEAAVQDPANRSAAGPAQSPNPGAESMSGTGAPQFAGSQSTTDRMAEERRLRLIRRTVYICGHVVFATLGLACGYWILCWLRPEADILGFFK